MVRKILVLCMILGSIAFSPAPFHKTASASINPANNPDKKRESPLASLLIAKKIPWYVLIWNYQITNCSCQRRLNRQALGGVIVNENFCGNSKFESRYSVGNICEGLNERFGVCKCIGKRIPNLYED